MHTPAQTRTNIGSEKDDTSKECCTMCVYPQPLILLLLTLLITISATVMLSVAIMTDHWEHVTWNSLRLAKITNNSMDVLEWVFDGKVGILHHKTNQKKLPPIFLVPMHGGIWTLCIDLTSLEIQSLKRYKKFPVNIVPCVNYLGGTVEIESKRNDWRHSELQQTTLQPHLRMQNLSISCSLVCLIILGSAALVGTFGICQRQISAILITGIMYLLAALFALFTLMIIHYKRQHGRLILENDIKSGTVDGLVGVRGAIKTQHLLEARIIITSWSLDLGWGGVVLCSITSVMWILLSKILRYNPISTFAI